MVREIFCTPLGVIARMYRALLMRSVSESCASPQKTSLIVDTSQLSLKAQQRCMRTGAHEAREPR
jgi:hypothetical protein